MNIANILAVDPGTHESGFVILSHSDDIILAGVIPNERLLEDFEGFRGQFVVEWFESMGMVVGREVFETVCWIGRFQQAIGRGKVTRVTRREVKLNLCRSMRARDKNVRQAILDRYPASGGGKNPQVGLKSNPGPLYGVKSHAWSALAVGITYLDSLRSEE